MVPQWPVSTMAMMMTVTERVTQRECMIRMIRNPQPFGPQDGDNEANSRQRIAAGNADSQSDAQHSRPKASRLCLRGTRLRRPWWSDDRKDTLRGGTAGRDGGGKGLTWTEGLKLPFSWERTSATRFWWVMCRRAFSTRTTAACRGGAMGGDACPPPSALPVWCSNPSHGVRNVAKQCVGERHRQWGKSEDSQ